MSYRIRVNGTRMEFAIHRGDLHWEGEGDDQCDGCGRPIRETGRLDDRRGRLGGEVAVRCAECGAQFPAVRDAAS